MSKKVAIIIPSFNRADRLPRAIESVFEQSFKDWHLWIVDDGSTDNTASVLKKYESHPQVSVLRTENRGVSAARNLAISESESEWLAFLDSDDEWLPGKLEKQMELISANPNLYWVHGEELWIRNGVRVNPMKKHRKSGGIVFKDSLKLCCVSPSTVVIKRELFQEVGLFKEDYPVCEDYDLWLRLSHKYPIGFVEDPIIKKYGGHDDQLSRKYVAMDFWRVKSIAEILAKSPLTVEQKLEAQSELHHKAQVLMKGYRKHENLSHYDEVFRSHLV